MCQESHSLLEPAVRFQTNKELLILQKRQPSENKHFSNIGKLLDRGNVAFVWKGRGIKPKEHQPHSGVEILQSTD